MLKNASKANAVFVSKRNHLVNVLVWCALLFGLFCAMLASSQAFATVDTTTKADQQAAVIRVAGNESADTASEIASQTYSSSKWVVIARDDDFADAMSATGLAGTLDAPILLTGREALSSETLERIESLGADSAYIIGGKGAIPGDLESQLDAIGVNTHERIFGNEYWETSVECAKYIKSNGGNPNKEAIVAMGTNFQDALSISSYAYANKIPIFLETNADNGNNLTDDAQNAIWSIVGNNNTIYVPGGPGAVRTETVEGVFDSEGQKSRVKRMYGDNGFDTSKAIAETLVSEEKLSCKTVVIANGAEGPKGTDALAGAALAGKNGGVILLANSNESCGDVSTVTLDDFLSVSSNAKQVESAYILGGAYVMPESVMTTTQSALWKWAKVTFNTNAGSSVESQSIWNGGKIDAEKATTTRDGYAFLNWSTNASLVGGEVDFSKLKVRTSTVLYANWEAADGSQTHNVSFRSNGGSDVPTQVVIEGTSAQEPETPVRSGFTLKGWYTDKSLTNQFDFDTEVTEDTTLYAKWAENISGVLNVTYDETAFLAIANATDVKSDIDLAYQWFTENEDGTYEPIEGATSSNYHPTDENVGKKLIVQAHDSASSSEYGGYLEACVVIPSFKEDPDNPDDISGSAQINGTPSVGSTLTASTSNVQSDVKPAYQWYTFDVSTGVKTAISWAKGSTYTPTAQDCGKQIMVEVTDSSESPRNGSISASVSIPSNLPIAGNVYITTDATSGSLSLQVSDMQSDVSPVYQWYVVDEATGDKTPIADATKTTYTPTSSDAGKKICVEVTDGSSNPHPGSLSAQAVVSGGQSKSLEGNVIIVGTPTPGETLRVQANVQSDAQPVYTWYRINPTTGTKTLIKDVTVNRYNLTATDSGMAFECEVTDGASGGYEGSVSAQVNLPVIQYTLSFDSMGGSSISSQKVNSNTCAAKPANPTYEGNAFMGWFTDEECTQAFDFATKITSDVTLYAKWVAGNVATYSVYHYKQTTSGEYPSAANATESLEGVAGSQTNAVVRDYSIQGYKPAADITVNQENIASDGSTVIRIYYPLNSYDIVFNANGHGTPCTKQTVLYGALATEPTPEDVSGYTFYGWFTDQACSRYTKYDFSKMVRESATLYAKWVSDFTADVTINGNVAVGQKLTASVVNAPSDATLAYKWYRDGEEISGAKSSTYTPVAKDLGCQISVEVSDGNTTDPHVGSVTSNKTSKVLNSAIYGRVTIEGDAVSGETLTASTADLPADITTPAYQWYRGDTAIEGATNQTYVLTEADEGHSIKVKVTDGANTNPHYGELFSQATANVARSAINGTLTIEGSVEEGGTITAVLQLDPSQTDVVPSYQWYRNGVAIEGEIRTSHVISDQNDYGATFYVTVKDSSSNPHTGALESSVTDPVIRTFIEGSVTVEGTAAVGQTLSATATGTQVDATPLAYQWCYLNDESELVNIEGACESTYTITSSAAFNPIGKQIVCKVSDGSSFPHGSFIQSEPTSAVQNTIITGDFELSPSGTCAIGTELSVKTSNLPEGLSPTYEWLLCAQDGTETVIQSGTDKTTYTPKASDQGSYIMVKLTDSNASGYSGVLQAKTQTAVSKNAIEGTVTISGQCEIGQTLTANATISEAQKSSVWPSYQWYRDDTPVEGAQRKTYTLTDSDAGHTIIVKVSDANPNDPYSRSIDAIAGSLDKLPLSGTVTISGVLATNQPLTATVTNLPEDVDQADLLYQWYNVDSNNKYTPISGATESTYSPKRSTANYKYRLVCEVKDGTAVSPHSGYIRSEPTDVIREGYSITYNLSCTHVTNSPNNPTGYISEVGVLSFEEPTRPGYTFEGWYKTDTATGQEIKVESIPAGTTGDITLTPKFTPTPTSSKENKGDYWLSAENTSTEVSGTIDEETGLATLTSSNGKFTYTVSALDSSSSSAIAGAAVDLSNAGDITVTLPDGSQTTAATIKVSTDASQQQPKEGVNVTVKFEESYVSGQTNASGVLTAKLSEATEGSPSNRVTIKTSSELDSDIAKIKSGDDTVIAQYNCYLHSEDVNLESEVADANGELHSLLFRIIEVGNHDENEGLTFQSTFVLDTPYSFNSVLNNAGGWANSDLRKSMNNLDGAPENSIFSRFKTALTNKIIPVTKKSGRGYQTSSITTTSDKIWVPSYVEITGASLDGLQDGEGQQYSWYKNVAKVVSEGFNTSIIPTLFGTTGSVGSWWTRSSYTTYNGFVAKVNDSGFLPVGTEQTDTATYVAVCFAM